MLAGVIRRWRGSRADGLLCGAVVLAILSSCTNFDRDRFAVRVDADGKIEVLACEGALPAEVALFGLPLGGDETDARVAPPVGHVLATDGVELAVQVFAERC